MSWSGTLVFGFDLNDLDESPLPFSTTAAGTFAPDLKGTGLGELAAQLHGDEAAGGYIIAGGQFCDQCRKFIQFMCVFNIRNNGPD